MSTGNRVYLWTLISHYNVADCFSNGNVSLSLPSLLALCTPSLSLIHSRKKIFILHLILMSVGSNWITYLLCDSGMNHSSKSCLWYTLGKIPVIVLESVPVWKPLSHFRNQPNILPIWKSNVIRRAMV